MNTKNLLVLFFFSLLCWNSCFGQSLQVRKSVEREPGSNTDYKVTISFRATGGKIPQVDIVDNLPETVTKRSGELTATAKNVCFEII